MSRLTLQRAPGGYTEHLLPFECVLDGNVVGSLGPSESRVFELTPGTHEIFVRILWCRSEKVTIHLVEGEQVIFRCQTRARLLTDVYWATFGRQRYLMISEVETQ